jgi:hypothetical protein
MATKITSTKGSFDFVAWLDISIPTVESGDLQSNQVIVGSRQHAYPKVVWHVDLTTPMPATPPGWVMVTKFLKDLVKDGSVTVQ